MTSRIPLPLRLVQCDLWATKTNGRLHSGHKSPNSQVLTVYKPSGLPCYAASQVKAVTSAGGNGRRLCAIHTRYTSDTSSSATIVESGPQPRPEDPSDSLLSRIIDAALPGCAPYVALPVVSSLLRRGGHDTAPAAQLNQWTSRCKGLLMVTKTPSDALFLRNAAQLDLVRQTYRVVCRLPPGVSTAARRYLRIHDSGNPHVASEASLTEKGLLNPYVQAHMERRRRQQQLSDLTVGIPLIVKPLAAPGMAGGTVVSALTPDYQLPESVHPHPLVTGGFFDVAHSQLRVQGIVRCYLRTQEPLAETSAARVHQQTRLKNLFLARSSARTDYNSATSIVNEDMLDSRHPWIPPRWRLGVSLDAPHMHCDVGVEGGGNAHVHRSAAVPAPRGKLLSMRVRLVSLSPHEGSDIALYEVHTHGDTTADEVAAVFTSEGLHVVNDYVQDVSLAMAVEEVANRMRAAPPSLLHELPLGLQHQLRSATAEELVALPLTRMPLEDADRLATHDNLVRVSSLPSSFPFSEDVERLRQVVNAATSPTGSNSRFPLQRLLLHALSSLKLTNPSERHVYQQVIGLTLGSGVECAGVVFPEPSDPDNVRVLQQLWLTYEQERQRHASLADAARAARQHPLASSLRYCTRNILDDPAGLTRVPLLTDVSMEIRSGTAVKSVAGSGTNNDASSARGECSFTQAVELLGAPLYSPSVYPKRISSNDETHDKTDAGLREDNAITARWEQIEVPPPYQVAFRNWCMTSVDPASFTDAATSVEGTPFLLPSPEKLLERCDLPGTSHAHESDSSTTSSAESCCSSVPSLVHATPTIRVLLRVEELAELSCAYCGASGHSWQHCVSRVAETVTGLENDGAASDSGLQPESCLSTRNVSPGPKPLGIPSDSSVIHSEGLTSVDDTVALLTEQARAVSRYGQNSERQHLEVDGRGNFPSSLSSESAVSFTGDGPLIAVPNVAATHRYKADHSLRSESKKPSVYRRVIRCVYCGGRHHVAMCPTLRAQDQEADVRQVNALQEPSPESVPLTCPPPRSDRVPFCIKCGHSGHLYTSCRQIPAGLHHATHCPICQKPRTSVSHDPAHCPQRKPVPEGYLHSGIPSAAKEITHHTITSDPSSSRSASGSDRDRSLPTARRQLESANTHVDSSRRRRRRRGSVLIADSYVD